jgi:hypothetical protein
MRMFLLQQQCCSKFLDFPLLFLIQKNTKLFWFSWKILKKTYVFCILRLFAVLGYDFSELDFNVVQATDAVDGTEDDHIQMTSIQQPPMVLINYDFRERIPNLNHSK